MESREGTASWFMATKRNNSRKSSSSKSAAKRSSAAKGRKKTEQEKSAANQMAAVLLLAGAVLLLCLLLIEGGSLWGVLHRFLFGLFGLCAFLLPPLMAYIAVAMAREKTAGSVGSKLWQCVLLIALTSSAVHIFTSDISGNYFTALGGSYQAGVDWIGGGFVGAILGYPMEYLFTDIGAKIIAILLIFVFFMLVTGTTVIAFLRTLMKPVNKTKKTIEEAMIAKSERKKAPVIDVDLGDGYIEMPEHPVRSEKKRRDGRAKDPAAEPAVDLPVIPPVQELPAEEPPSDKLNALEQAARELRAANGDAPLKLEDLANGKKETGADDSIAAELQAGALPKEGADGYRYPPISLLDEARPVDDSKAQQEQQTNAALLVKTLNDFGVSTKVIDVSRGPSVTRYELEPSAGVKLSKITGLADDIALRLATTGVRIEAPIPNKAAVGIEVPNRVSSMVCLRELIDSPEFSLAKSKLTVALGRDIAGKIVLADLAKMPHLLIAGTTGSGKSVCTNSMIQSILYRASPSDVRMLLIDPKQVEFGVYNGIPHLLVPVVTDPRKAAGALGWAVTEMLNRYKIFAENNVRDLGSYNELAKKSDTLHNMPQILIVIDELADLMMAASNEVEDAIVRLAQMARAAGMHLVIATQRPSVDVITGLIKANIPSRLALTVASAVDSRTILDGGGAEKLLGRGDMLFMPVGLPKPMRVQGCFVSNQEVESVVGFLKSTEESEYDEAIIQEIDRQAAASGKSSAKAGGDEEEGDGDEMLPQAIEVVVEAGMASTSLLQRKLRLGYARAGRIIDEMERRGIVGPHEGSKPRQVLITRQQWLEMNLNREE